MVTSFQTRFTKATTVFPATAFAIKALALSLWIALSAQISLPFWPVPMTLQPMSIITIGLVCHPSVSMAAIMAYLLEGALGFPVFHNFHGGLAHMMGTTGGYLLGFVLMVGLIGRFKSLTTTFVQRFLLVVTAHLSLFIPGVLWLSTFIGWDQALQWGFYPFIVKIPVEGSFALLTAFFIQSIRKPTGK